MESKVSIMSERTDGAQRLVIPGLGRFYDCVAPLSYLLMRVYLGLMLVPHGADKLFGAGVLHTAQGLTKLGWPAPLFWAWAACIIEFFGGLMLAVGLLTRVAAAAIAIEMAVISFAILWPAWDWAHHGMEYVFMVGVFAFAMALRGGGPYSLDRVLGREI